MKSKLLTLICVFILSSLSYASDSSKGHGRGKKSTKMTVGVAIGAGVPMGWFGKKDTVGATAPKDTAHHAGYAKLGINFNLNFAYKFTDAFGVMLVVGGNLNGFDGKSYDAAWGNSFNHTSSTVTTGTTNYIGSYMLGPFISFPGGDKLTLNIRLLGGWMTANVSTITSVTPGAFGNYTQTAAYKASGTYCYGGGLGVSYNVSNAVSIPVTVDYLGGNPIITEETGTFGSFSFDSKRLKIGMGVGLINVAVGLAIHF